MKNKKILIGLSGGIAVYKICGLIRKFIHNGAQVRVIMTRAATNFVTPLTFQVLSEHPVYQDIFKPLEKEGLEHINLTKWCDILIIAPATANILSKIANGIADDLLTTIVLALPQKIPVLFAPAMETNMWQNPLLQRNITILKQQKKYFFVGPEEGKLASGKTGKGRMSENQAIFKAVAELLSQ